MTALSDSDPMPFGYHKGKAMLNVPAAWLLKDLTTFSLDKDYAAVRMYVEENLESLEWTVHLEKQANGR